MGKLFEYPEANSVVVCGDIHGDFHTLAYKMCIQYQMTDTLLIVAGDCGFGFDKPGITGRTRLLCSQGKPSTP